MLNVEDVRRQISLLGVSAHFKGSRALAYTIVLVDQHPDWPLVKGVYPEVGRLINATGSQVERCMRYAVDTLQKECDTETLTEYFGAAISRGKGKLTVSRFVHGVLQCMRNYAQ